MEVEIEVIFGKQNDGDLVEYFENEMEALQAIGKNINEGYFIRSIDISIHYIRRGELM